jgi:hypothetical protein
VALRVAVWLLVIVPALAANLVESDPAGTVTGEAGTGRSPLLLESATVVPVGAALFSFMVQVVTCPELKLAGLQVSEVSNAGASNSIVAVFVPEPRVAVKVTLRSGEPKAPAAALNVVEADPAGTVTDEAGTGSSVLSLAIDTLVPSGGAGLASVTVHVVTPSESRLVGLHVRELSNGATRLSVAVRGTPVGTAASA